MKVVSLGYRSDLMLLALRGSSIEEHVDCLVVRTPDNPTYHWGNFLLLQAPPAPGSVAQWTARFHAEFPDAEHIAIGVDGTDGAAGDPDELAAAGLWPDLSTVMTTEAVHEPPHPNRAADIRMLCDDRDWQAALELKEANNTDYEPVAYRAFAIRTMDAMRRLQERGCGEWFGAFSDGRMVSGLGVYTDGSGIARFQSVDTHPVHRGRGLAGTLVHTAGRYMLDRPDVHTLVMVADPGYGAIRIYRSVGFSDTEQQVQLLRLPPADRP